MVLERLGIAPEHEVVIYDQADGAMAAARAWVLFVLAGHQNVTVLNGGMNAWLALDLPTEDIVAVPEPSRYPVYFRMQRLIAEDELKVRLHSADALLLDARAPERFRGEVEPLDRKAGHIPGAVNRPYAQNLENGLFKLSEILRAEFDAAGAGSKEVLLSCGSGVTACHNALALSHAGLDHWRLFAPSWSGWIADDANQVAIGG
jgi:thiosulfate/3-mercaptopyruvate sulfurtransferase